MSQYYRCKISNNKRLTKINNINNMTRVPEWPDNVSVGNIVFLTYETFMHHAFSKINENIVTVLVN